MRCVRVEPFRHDLLRVSVDPGTFTVTYGATVTLRPTSPTTSRAEVPFADLPGDVLGYLHPSRYCQSDLLSRLADQTFGHLEPGFERVTGICNWIWELLSYVPGSTDASTTAVDVLVSPAAKLSCTMPIWPSASVGHSASPPATSPGTPSTSTHPTLTDLRGLPRRRLVPLRRHAHGTDRWAVRIATGRDAADAAFAALVERPD